MLEENGGRCDEATKPRALRGRLGREGGVRVSREKKGDEPGVRTDGRVGRRDGLSDRESGSLDFDLEIVFVLD